MATDPAEAVPDTTYFGQSLEKLTIAYLKCLPHGEEKNSFHGGLLLTDWLTRPVDFIYAAPVKLSTMQRLLHGAILEEVVLVDVITKSLLEECPKTRTPSVLFIDWAALKQVVRVFGGSVVHLKGLRSSTSRGADGSPLEFDHISSGRDAESTLRFLRDVGGRVDLLEPFARVSDAISEASSTAP